MKEATRIYLDALRDWLRLQEGRVAREYRDRVKLLVIELQDLYDRQVF